MKKVTLKIKYCGKLMAHHILNPQRSMDSNRRHTKYGRYLWPEQIHILHIQADPRSPLRERGHKMEFSSSATLSISDLLMVPGTVPGPGRKRYVIHAVSDLNKASTLPHPSEWGSEADFLSHYPQNSFLWLRISIDSHCIVCIQATVHLTHLDTHTNTEYDIIKYIIKMLYTMSTVKLYYIYVFYK